MAERLVVDQRMCDSVKFMLAGGAPVMKVQALLGISPATISRIRRADFSAAVFMENNMKRRQADRKAEEPETEIAGQMQMVLPEKEEKAPAQQEESEGMSSKDMRYWAAMVEKILKKMDQLIDEVKRIPSF